MPSINLRLTDEQHAQVERWAALNDRSIQKEIVHRLFTQREAGPLRIDVPEQESHFKPDPKPTRAEKSRRFR